MENTKRWVPVLPVRNTVLFPGQALPLRVGRPASIAAVAAAVAGDGQLLALTQRSAEGEATADGLYRVGTIAKIEKHRGSAESGFQVLARGLSRVRVIDLRSSPGASGTAEPGTSPYTPPENAPETPPETPIEALIEPYEEVRGADEATATALLTSLKRIASDILDLIPADTTQLSELLASITDLGLLGYLCAANIELEPGQRQELLEAATLRDRALRLLDLMAKQKSQLEVQSEIREKLAGRMGKVQREAILREQLKTIQDELGESEPESARVDYRKKIDEAGMPEETRKVALDELRRLEAVGNASPESHVIRNYLDLLCALPWSKSSSSELDIERAREILDHDHYGLPKIKRRILQHLAVMKLRKGGRGQILLFVGPPGVGKTSLGQSIARALGRKFARASLGGVRDDAEIRGHRRTYIGAMPGRIIQGIKRAGENNPLFMLDEVDKLAMSFQGDPAAALLEVLDPEQNAAFTDHYLDVPFDLSKVFFIATANTVETIPGPLLDRMEVIDLSGYTTLEKAHIARAHLIPKQLAEHGLTAAQLAIEDAALIKVISAYTREAGVRDLQRRIAAICRWGAERVVRPGAELPVKVSARELDEILGPEPFTHETASRELPPGVATGLAWTPQGGEILFVEAAVMPGAGRITLTGQLGEVMKESAQLALSLVRSRLAPLLPAFDFAKTDVHLHVPAGAIPKDGPSAGITLLTSIASLFSGRHVSPKLAMTGEITLRGVVMPVGGIKEKILAAHRAGIDRVILSRRNEKDLRDVPEEVRSQLRFELVDDVGDVLKLALGLDLTPLSPAAPAPAVA
jgi:ATP-dependent Lon protease